MNFGTLQDVETRGKTVLLRVDFNSPIDPSSNTILDDKRFREHIPTIQALEDARVVVLAHQSRPGKKDFTTLHMHSDAQFAGSSSVPAHVEMMGLIGMGNNPMVGASVDVAVAVAVAQAMA